MDRRAFLQSGTAAAALASLPRISFAQQLPFDPRPGAWRTYEITTRVEVLKPAGVTRVWVPVSLGMPTASSTPRSADSRWSLGFSVVF